LDPTQEKSKKKEKTSENITFIFSPQTFFVKKKSKILAPYILVFHRAVVPSASNHNGFTP
jgi:hypothetical protein